VTVRRSLKFRVQVASAVVFLGHAAGLCLLLPHLYARHLEEDLRSRADTLARSVACLFAGTDERASATRLPDQFVEWLAAESGVAGIALLDGSGNVIDGWPSEGAAWTLSVERDLGEEGSRRRYLGTATVPESPGPASEIVVRMATDGYVQERGNVRWLFASIFLLTGAMLLVLMKYLGRTVLLPIAEIRRAAENLADGEAEVNVPVSGDWEIAELGTFIRTLGLNRSRSRVFMPPDVKALQRLVRKEGTAPEERESESAPADE
jgi:hypothetical protein